MKFKIRTKILAGFTTILSVTFISGIISYTQLSNTTKTINNLIDKDTKLINMTNEARFNFSQQTTNIRGYALTQDESYVNNYKTLIDANIKLGKDLFDSSYSEEGKKLVKEVENYNIQYATTVEQKLFPLIKANQDDEVLNLMKNEIMPIANNSFEATKNLLDYRTQRMNERVAAVTKASETARIFILGAIISSLLLGIIIALFITRMITSPIKLIMEGAQNISDGDLTKNVNVNTRDEIGELAAIFNKMTTDIRNMITKISDTSNNLGATSQELLSSSEETTAGCMQISDTISQLASGAVQQSTSIDETNRLVNQLSEGFLKVAQNIETVSISSTNASNAANEGLLQSKDAIAKIKKLQDSSINTTKTVINLGKKSEEIDQIIEVIKNISDQTNLLALNAAIEAARAGEQGRGFAVVAEEIRKLAEQSSESAKQIETLIENIQNETKIAISTIEKSNNEVEAGVKSVNTAGNSFNIIVKEINRVVDETQQVSAAAQQMSSGSNQIVKLVNDVSVVSEESAAGTEEVSATAAEQTTAMNSVVSAAQSLSDLGIDLQNLVSKFKI